MCPNLISQHTVKHLCNERNHSELIIALWRHQCNDFQIRYFEARLTLTEVIQGGFHCGEISGHTGQKSWQRRCVGQIHILAT